MSKRSGKIKDEFSKKLIKKIIKDDERLSNVVCIHMVY